MMDPSIDLYIHEIPNPKVRYYCKCYVDYIESKFGRICDIYIAEFSQDTCENTGNPVLSLILNMIVKPTTAFILSSEPVVRPNIIPPDITEMIFLHPKSFPSIVGMVDFHHIANEIRESIEHIVRRTDNETVLDQYEIICMSFLDHVSFESQLYIPNRENPFL